MRHLLDPLLNPSSIALVGASPNAGSYGNSMIGACLEAGYEGDVFLVNPKYSEIDGRPCYPDFKSLPLIPEHAVLMVANQRIEQVFAETIAAGIKAATIFSSGYLDDGQPVPLVDRLRKMAYDAQVLVCGGNCLGFYNRVHKVRCLMEGHGMEAPGPVTFISQAGSILASVSENDGRLRFNLTVSSGQEITTDVSDYMDFALGLSSTRAIGLYIETIRNPQKFVSVLKRASAADIPVVIAKVARSERGKRFAVSHSGALAGDSAVYRAILKRYGAIYVDDPDELVATLQLMSTGKRAAPGELVSITDSGGERELLADVAADQGVAFAEISDKTREILKTRLEYGLVAENPVDAWGTGHNYEEIFGECFTALLKDPQAGLGLWIADVRDAASYYQHFANIAIRISKTTDKPIAFATCFSKCMNEGLANKLADAGIPVLEGMRPAMVAVRSMLEYSAFRRRPAIVPPPAPPASVVDRWLRRCATRRSLGESESLALLSDFGVIVVEHRLATSQEEALAATTEIGFPVALKTAETGIHHKSDVGGVHLSLSDAQAVTQAYGQLAGRIGPRVLISKMASPGVEISFGFVRDPQFGPIIVVGAGGVLIELLHDVRLAVPPVDRNAALNLINDLSIRPMLSGFRGKDPCDIDALATMLVKFSVMVIALESVLSEVDINPIIVSAEGAVVVDALIIPNGCVDRKHEVENV